MTPAEWQERLQHMSRCTLVELTPHEAGELARVLSELLARNIKLNDESYELAARVRGYEMVEAAKRPSANTPQPAPVHDEDSGAECWPALLAEVDVEPWLAELIRERDAMGRAKYGTALRVWNGRDAAVDALQEALDLLVYLQQCLMRVPEMDPWRWAPYNAHDRLRAARDNALRMVLEIASMRGLVPTNRQPDHRKPNYVAEAARAARGAFVQAPQEADVDDPDEDGVVEAQGRRAAGQAAGRAFVSAVAKWTRCRIDIDDPETGGAE